MGADQGGGGPSNEPSAQMFYGPSRKVESSGPLQLGPHLVNVPVGTLAWSFLPVGCFLIFP